MQAWSQFYAAVAAASAALLGLLFVVVSINAPAALGPEEAVSRRLTEQAFQNYLAVLMVALLALFADISAVVFGWRDARRHRELVGLGGRPLRPGRHEGGERRPWLVGIRRHLSSLIGFGMLLFATLRMALRLGRRLQLAGGLDARADVLGDDRVMGAADANRQAQAGLDRPRDEKCPLRPADEWFIYEQCSAPTAGGTRFSKTW